MPIASCLVTLLHIPPPRGFRTSGSSTEVQKNLGESGVTDDPQASRLNKVVIFSDSEYDYMDIKIMYLNTMYL